MDDDMREQDLEQDSAERDNFVAGPDVPLPKAVQPKPRLARLQNPSLVLENGAIKNLFAKAFEGDPITRFADAEAEIAALVSFDNCACFVVAEGGRFVGLAMVHLPVTKSIPIPNVSAFYSEGSPRVKKLLIDAVVEFVMGNGYTEFLAVNRTDAADSVWARSFLRGGKAERTGSIMRFKIGE